MRWPQTYAAFAVALALVAGPRATNRINQADEKVLRSVPRFVVSPFWPKPAPKRWVTEEVGATCVDSKDHVVTLNRGTLLPIEVQLHVDLSPPVIEYDEQGNVVNAWGDRSLLPKILHGCYFDQQDNVWMTDAGGGVVQKWSHNGSKLLLQIGNKGVCDGVGGACGSPGLNSSHTLLNEPAAVAVDRANGDIYIADGYGNHRVVVFDRSGRYLRQWGAAGREPGQFAPEGGGHPHCVVLHNDLVYVCDRSNDRIQVFDKFGNIKDVISVVPENARGGRDTQDAVGSASDLGFSPDGRYMYVADIRNTTLWIFDHASNAVLGGFGRPGHSTGELTSFHSLAVDSKGNIYTGEVTGRRIQKFVPKGFVDGGTLSTFLDRPHYEPIE
jgi:hypothetical protein